MAVYQTASLECRGLGFMAILQTQAVTVIALACYSGGSDELMLDTGREAYSIRKHNGRNSNLEIRVSFHKAVGNFLRSGSERP